MMTTNIQIDNNIIISRLNVITNQIYKLLPVRQQGSDWKKPLQTIIEQLFGFGDLFKIQSAYVLIVKLNGLKFLVQEDDFLLYRRTIFECLSLMGKVIEDVKSR